MFSHGATALNQKFNMNWLRIYKGQTMFKRDTARNCFHEINVFSRILNRQDLRGVNIIRIGLLHYPSFKNCNHQQLMHLNAVYFMNKYKRIPSLGVIF